MADLKNRVGSREIDGGRHMSKHPRQTSSWVTGVRPAEPIDPVARVESVSFDIKTEEGGQPPHSRVRTVAAASHSEYSNAQGGTAVGLQLPLGPTVANVLIAVSEDHNFRREVFGTRDGVGFVFLYYGKEIKSHAGDNP